MRPLRLLLPERVIARTQPPNCPVYELPVQPFYDVPRPYAAMAPPMAPAPGSARSGSSRPPSRYESRIGDESYFYPCVTKVLRMHALPLLRSGQFPKEQIAERCRASPVRPRCGPGPGGFIPPDLGGPAGLGPGAGSPGGVTINTVRTSRA